jgi:hypothetical protein
LDALHAQVETFAGKSPVLMIFEDVHWALFSVLYGFWTVSFQHFNREAACNLAAHFLELAEKQPASGPVMVGHRLLGTSVSFAGDFLRGRAHYDQAFALYDPVEHRPLATRFGQDLGVAILTWRSWTVWCLGYPNSARIDLERGITHAREIGQAATLMYALAVAGGTNLLIGDYAAEIVFLDELAGLAEQKGAMLWRVLEKCARGWLLTMTGNPSDAVQMLNTSIAGRPERQRGPCFFAMAYAIARLDALHAEIEAASRI